MKLSLAKSFLLGSLALNALFLVSLWQAAGVRDSHADPGATEELLPYMETMQHIAHKLGLSIQSRNAPLAAFYLEEIEETVAVIQKKFPLYDNFKIGQLAGVMFVPSIEPLEKSVKAANWPVTNAGFTKMIDSCNTCHVATGHGFVKITAPTGNPFNQSFSPQ